MSIVDLHGKPYKKEVLTKEIAAPTLTGIRTLWHQTVASGLTPVRLANLLMAAAEGDHNAYLTLAEEMEERDMHYASELGKRKLAVSRLPISVESYSDSAYDKKLADAIRSMIRRPGFRGLLKDSLDGLGKGFSATEIVWSHGQQWAPKSYEWRDPRFFQFDQVSGKELRLRDEADLVNGIELAPYKYIVHVPKIKSGIPIRGGLARLAAWAYMCKAYTIKDWLAFAEVFGMPLRMGKYRSGADEADINVLKMAVANLGTDAAAVFPEGMTIEFQEAAKTGSAQFFKILAEYLDDQISKGILGQTASSSGTPGKLGNEELQAEVRDDIRDDDAEQLEETLQRDLIIPFIDLNYGPQENYPCLQLRAIKPENITALTAALKELVPLGLKVEQSVIRDKIGLPDPDQNAKPEDLLQPATAQPVPAINHQQVALNSEQSTDAVDDMVADELTEWQPLMAPVIDPLREMIANAKNLEEFKSQLATLIDKQDLSPLVEALATATLKARALGDATDEV